MVKDGNAPGVGAYRDDPPDAPRPTRRPQRAGRVSDMIQASEDPDLPVETPKKIVTYQIRFHRSTGAELTNREDYYHEAFIAGDHLVLADDLRQGHKGFRPFGSDMVGAGPFMFFAESSAIGSPPPAPDVAAHVKGTQEYLLLGSSVLDFQLGHLQVTLIPIKQRRPAEESPSREPSGETDVHISRNGAPEPAERPAASRDEQGGSSDHEVEPRPRQYTPGVLG